MAIDYFIQYPCKVRAAITDDELLRMVKSRGRVTAMRDALQSDPRTVTDPEPAKDDATGTQRDERTQEFKHLLSAAAFAGSNGVVLLVDA